MENESNDDVCWETGCKRTPIYDITDSDTDEVYPSCGFSLNEIFMLVNPSAASVVKRDAD